MQKIRIRIKRESSMRVSSLHHHIHHIKEKTMAKTITKSLSLVLASLFLLLSAFSLLPPANGISDALPVTRLAYGTLSFPSPSPDQLEPLSAAPVSLRTAAAGRYQELKLYPGGIPFGVKFMTEGVMIVGFNDVRTDSGTVNPAKNAKLQPSDLILKIDGRELTSAAELSEIVEKSDGKPLEILYSRDGNQGKTILTPAYSTAEGRYVTGLYVRDSGAGIGTVTFVLPETNAFAGLGHGICDGGTGKLIPMQRGSVVGVTINGVVRGLAGSPGEVKGYFSSGKVGSLIGNTECGVFGVFAKCPEGLPSEPLPIGLRNELREGKATIYCTLDGGAPKAYTVTISEIVRDSHSNKCFTVKVTDKALIEKTGGIIQGMSGSPIIQDGKIVGAVTHVLINDPTTGYGIFIENMLDQMGELAS